MIPAVNVLNNLFRPLASGHTRFVVAHPDARSMSRATADSPLPIDAAEGIVALHGACATVVRLPEPIVRSTSVLVPVVDFPLPPTSLVDLAERIACEHGLIATATVDQRFLRVRLARSGATAGQVPERRREAPAWATSEVR